MIMMGSRYRLMSHPDRPVGITKGQRPGEILVVWEDSALLPPSEWFPEEMFSNGKFEMIREDYSSLYGGYVGDYGHERVCLHEWKNYQGFCEEYEFCVKCDIKRQ